MPVRILFLSDTHLGIDLPSRPRVARPRRGDDFFDSFERALAPAFAGESDIAVHGGDLFYRSRIPAWLAERVFSRLADLADAGVDVFWVPGNHERSGVPRSLFLTHPRIHVFDRPRTFTVERGGLEIALSGFPYAPRVRRDFASLVAAASPPGARPARPTVRLLCIHQTVEGAAVGPDGFVFRGGDDVIRGADVPPGFAAVLCGHIHRHQVLGLASPVLYPGSTERTSFAERNEPKGTLLLDVEEDAAGRACLTWSFRELPVRPMVDLAIDPGPGALKLEERLRRSFAALDPRSVVRIRLIGEYGEPGELPEAGRTVVRAESLRAMAPGMTVAFARSVRSGRVPAR